MEAGKSAYPDSWYAATLGEVAERPALRSSVQCDTAVVGAGLAGLTTALECCRRGQSVVLLESRRVAWGASGRNGGMVLPGFAVELPELVEVLGMAAAQRLYEHSIAGVDYVRSQAQQLAPEVLMGQGGLSVSRHPDAASCRSEQALLETMQFAVPEHWGRRELQNLLQTDRYHDALYDATSFHLHPLRYAHALATEFERLGGRLYEQTPILDFTEAQNTLELRSHGGLVSCDDIVLCTSAYDHTLYRPLSRAILPVATYVAVTEPLDNERQPVKTQASIIDTRRAGDYYRRIDDGRLLWGGKITTRQRVPEKLQQVMQETIAATYPQLHRVGIDSAWAGLMGYARHKMPIIGEVAPRIWSATAFGGHGLNTTAMAGLLVARGICDRDETWRDFSVFKPQWAGGLVGRLAVQGTYYRMQWQDYLAERRAINPR
ncbi:MAG: FAD-binding oxidoreductase [Gammaproteobacteria bacterium]|nr:FAD-binding oxidoreductase [Gammaproteobacteria bacterium]